MESFDEYKLRHYKYDRNFSSWKLSIEAENLIMIINDKKNNNIFDNLCDKILKNNMVEILYIANYYNDNGKESVANTLFSKSAMYSREVHPELWKRFFY